METRVGRPTKYNEEIADRILTELATTKTGFETICEEQGISPSTGWNWLNSHPSFLERYAQARLRQSELGFDEMRDIADAPLPTTTVYSESGENLGEKVDAGVAMAEINKRKLQIDVIKFQLMKLQPKRYGDNRSLEVDVKVRKVLGADQMAELRRGLIAKLDAPKEDFEDADTEEV